ncbi:creatininase family protein [Candidatus Micrarchaeota archaeon]|nr:creatininase family protein [Candidatus Micrarchaeota archaeon]
MLLSKKKNLIPLPTLHYSISPEHSDFPGTIVIDEKTLLKFLNQIYHSLKSFGLKELTILNCHGGNHTALDKLGKGFRVINIWRLIPHNHFEHAGELETSLMLALMPSNVNLNKATKGKFLDKKIKNIRVADYSKSGVMGDATKASKAKGRKLLSTLLKKLQQLI